MLLQAGLGGSISQISSVIKSEDLQLQVCYMCILLFSLYTILNAAGMVKSEMHNYIIKNST